MQLAATLITLSLLAGSAGAQANSPVYKCDSALGASFTLAVKDNPDNESQATVIEQSPGLKFDGTSAWLIETKKGFSTTIYQYDLVGGKLSVSETIFMTRGGNCGRGACDGGNGNTLKSIQAKFVSNDKTQQIDFDCN